MRLTILISLNLLLVAGGATSNEVRAADPQPLEPDARAKPHVAFQWKSAGGLRYTWVLPRDYKPGEPRNLVLILHGTGLDYRWGLLNNKPGQFRPDDIVVSVDGTSPGQGDTRLFLGNPQDAKAFKEFLGELRKLFRVRDVFLYGHSQGGFFVVYFAGEYPEEVAGVVAHASGAWARSKDGKKVHPVAVAFMHGTWDPVVPYRQSVGSRDQYVKRGFPMVHLRRLERYNHWPNATRANEVLAWCVGMTTEDPVVAFESVRSILVPKRPDEYQWETTVDYAGAIAVLGRFAGKGPRAFEKVPEKLAAAASKEVARIEKAAQRHVAAVQKLLGKNKKLRFDGRPWLGYLISLREDFRGSKAVEKFVSQVKYDKLLAAQQDPAGNIIRIWYRNNARALDIYQTVIKELPRAHLYEGYPPELAEKMAEWKRDAQKHKLTRKDLQNYAIFEAWKTSWDEGLKAYRGQWKKWK